MGPLKWRLTLTDSRIEAELLLKGTRIGDVCEIQLDLLQSPSGIAEEAT